MRRANFPDQKALTARGETDSKASQQRCAGSSTTVVTYCLAWAAQGWRKTLSRKHFVLPNPATLIAALVTCVAGSSVPVRSCHFPMQSCHMGDPDVVFSWEPSATRSREMSMTVHFQTASWLGPVQGGPWPYPFLTGPDSLAGPPPECLAEAGGLPVFPLLDLCGSMRECAGSKASSRQSHWAHCSVVLGFTSPILVHWFFSPFLGF